MDGEKKNYLQWPIQVLTLSLVQIKLTILQPVLSPPLSLPLWRDSFLECDSLGVWSISAGSALQLNM